MNAVSKVAVMALASTLSFACSVVGIRTVKEPPFRVIVAEAEKEIRSYDSFVVARTTVETSYDGSGREGFRRLFRYISGQNAAGGEIAMTAPVLQERGGQEIAMTAPVLQTQTGEARQMAFVLPQGLTLETAPRPLDDRVELAEVPARTVAVMRYRGLVSEEDITERGEELRAWLADKPFRVVSGPQSARYDPPFTLPFLRRNEVHVAIEPVEPPPAGEPPVTAP